MDKEIIHIITMDYYPVIKKNNFFLPFAAMWMDLENITLGKIRQTQKDKQCVSSLI